MTALIADRDEMMREIEKIKDTVLDTSKQTEKLEELTAQRVEIIDQMKQLTAQNAAVAMDQDAYTAQFDQLSERCSVVQDQLVLLEKTIQDIHYRRTRTAMVLEILEQQESLIPEFSSDLWSSLIDRVTVYIKDAIRVVFV